MGYGSGVRRVLGRGPGVEVQAPKKPWQLSPCMLCAHELNSLPQSLMQCSLPAQVSQLGGLPLWCSGGPDAGSCSPDTRA